MNQDIKQKWVNALRSGEYEQTTGMLQNDEGFCCLGVLCDLHAKETGGGWVASNNGYAKSYLGNDGLLPHDVGVWAELPPTDRFTFTPMLRLGDDLHHATDLNDSGHTFTEIAVMIEAQL